MNTNVRTGRPTLVAIAMLLCASPAAFPQAGSLDPSFANNGTLAFSTATLTAANAVAIQSDGKIVVAGGGPQNSNQSVPDVLVRLNADGTLDSSFGSGGIFTFNPSGFPAGFFALAIQSDGKIVAASTSFLQLVRVKPNGSLDSSFGANGVTRQISSAVASDGSLALQSDGKIVVAFSCIGCGEPSQVARYDSNGQLDSSFGNGGFANLILAGPATAPARIAIQPGGKILIVTSGLQSTPPLAVNTSPTSSLVRYNSNGTVDQTFGAQGIVPVLSAEGLLLQSDGKIVVAGGLTSAQNPTPAMSDIGFCVARYDARGADKSFGVGGVAITDFGASAPLSAALALALQSNGDIVAAGIAGLPTVVGGNFPATPTSFGLARYTGAGALDNTFGSGGIVITTVASSTNSWISSLAVQADGKIVAAGTSGSTGKEGFTSAAGYVMRYLGQ